MIKIKKVSNYTKYFLIPSIFIIIIVTILNFFLYNQEFDFYKNIYDNEVAGTTSLLNRRIQTTIVATESIQALFLSSTNVTKEEFDIFGSVLTKNINSNIITVPISIEWIDEKNNIRYVYPMNKDNDKVLGLDLNKYPNRLLPITKAKTTQSTVITEPIMLGQGYPGLILYSPIFRNNKYLGEAVIVIRLSNLVSPIPGNNPIYSKNEYIQTDNFIIPFDDDVIFNNKGERIINPQGDLVKDPVSQEYLGSTEGVISQDIVFADKTWQLKFFPTYITEVYKIIEVYIGISLFFLILFIIFLWILNRQRERLSKEVAKNEALIISLGDGLVACDKYGIITFINKKAEELFGYSAQESIGKSYYDVWHVFDSKGVTIPEKERGFYRALNKREIVNISISDHLYILKKNDTRFPLGSTISPIIVNGNLEGAIVIFRDITKESEIDRMKTEFLSLTSHQLLTPTSAIKWTSELLLNEKNKTLNEKQIKSIQDIYISNENIISLINSLLNISRIESGRIMIDPKPTYLNELVDEIVVELKNKIEKKEQLFNFDFENNLPKINIDPNLIKEVYKNLLTNAIKYTPAKGNISVTISKIKNDIVSKISDNGYGIMEKDKNRVFEKFYRGENIIAIEKDGNGLGLYLIKQIIEVSGGKIWFESEINKGTTFYFSLPISGSIPRKGEAQIS